MKIREIIALNEGTESMSGLLTVLTHLKKMSKEKDTEGNYSTNSVINMVRNAGAQSFDYDNLVNAYESNQAVKDLIDNFNKKSLRIKLDTQVEAGGDRADSDQTVNQLAQQAVSL